MSFVRVFGQVQPSKHVSGVRLTVRSSSDMNVTDLQLNPGSSLFSWSPRVTDLHLRQAPTWRFANGIVRNDLESCILADEDLASPYRAILSPYSTATIDWSLIHAESVSSRMDMDGFKSTTSHGAGVTPVHVARADQDLHLTVSAPVSGIVGVKGVYEYPGENSRLDIGPVVTSHTDWWAAVLAWHPTWSDVLSVHGSW